MSDCFNHADDAYDRFLNGEEEYDEYDNYIEKSKRKVYIVCVGEDEKKHLCEPHKDICKCGIKVKSKKFNRDDHMRYGCYVCDN